MIIIIIVVVVINNNNNKLSSGVVILVVVAIWVTQDCIDVDPDNMISLPNPLYPSIPPTKLCVVSNDKSSPSLVHIRQTPPSHIRIYSF